MSLTQAQYMEQLLQLLPQGSAWPREAGATLPKLLEPLAEGLAQSDARAQDLLDEDDPRTTLEILKDWERVAGLPDACSGAVADTVRERQDILTAKITSRGGQSIAYFTDLAAALGYPITVTEFRPFQAGQSTASDPCSSEAWRFVWQVGAPETTIREFRSGEGSASEPLRDWGNEILECAITADKPAHTHVNFSYGG